MEIYIYTPHLELIINDSLVLLNYVYEQAIQIIASIKL